MAAASAHGLIPRGEVSLVPVAEDVGGLAGHSHDAWHAHLHRFDDRRAPVVLLEAQGSEERGDPQEAPHVGPVAEHPQRRLKPERFNSSLSIGELPSRERP